MRIEESLRRKIMTANVAEEIGQHALAEKLYQEALTEAVGCDRTLAGSLCINLGTNAERGGDLRAAVRYFSRAAETLDGRRGEALLQRAHALFNIARIELERKPRKAAAAAAEAVALYRRYPLSPTEDLADALALEVLARIRLDSPVGEDLLRRAWKTMRNARFESLNAPIATQFLSMLVQVLRAQDPEASTELLNEMDGWADPLLVQELQAVSAHGAEGAAILRKLQQALLR